MHALNGFFNYIDRYLGSSEWFVYLLLGTGLFFTIYLRFPQVRYFKHAIKVVKGVFDKKGDEGDTSHFQALATALSGTVGTGNIAGVALAIHVGGPAALFWMLVTAMLGMTTKFVEVTLSHKYREKTGDGTMAGGPMYYMRERLNIRLGNGKMIKTGLWLGIFFSFATILSSFGTGSLPQINSISNSMFATFGIKHYITGIILSVLLALVIVGGIRRIAKVTSKLVPAMAIFYFLGAIAVLIYNYDQIIPAIISVFTSVFKGSAATGGFLGAGFIYAFKRGVNRGLFSNEAGQGSAPIAHASAKAHEHVSEGLVAILEPFVDTIIICSLTGLTLLTSGVWTEKIQNRFQYTDLEILTDIYEDKVETDQKKLLLHLNGKEPLQGFDGALSVENGMIQNEVTVIHARSLAEGVRVFDKQGNLFSGKIPVHQGKIPSETTEYFFEGSSLIHSAPLTAEAFKRSFFGNFGQYIVAIGLLLFAFSTAISWSYYGDRAVTFLWGTKFILPYRLIYVAGFFLASIADTTVVWSLSYITIALMTIPNLFGLLILHREVKSTVDRYWTDFHVEFPDVKLPKGILRHKKSGSR
ncbi:MAG: sodium:alanine symporter family protein [Bacteroidales bacterium]|nr:sodium:alanine symporter family protein [Bacteroidales bacterium]